MHGNEASRESRDRPSTAKERFAVYQEQVKTAHTTHWDWDYLRREDIERLLRERAHQERARRAAVMARVRRIALVAGLIFTSLLLIGIDLNVGPG